MFYEILATYSISTKASDVTRGLLHNFFFAFQVENGLHGRSENIENLWHVTTDYSVFHHVFGKIMGY